MRERAILAGLVLLAGAVRVEGDEVRAPDPLPAPRMDWTEGENDEREADRATRRDATRRMPGLREGAGGYASARMLRIVESQAEARVMREDEVIVVRARAGVLIHLPPISGSSDGRVLVIKSVNTSGEVVVEGTDIGDVTLAPAQSVAVIASAQLGHWLVLAER